MMDYFYYLNSPEEVAEAISKLEVTAADGCQTVDNMLLLAERGKSLCENKAHKVVMAEAQLRLGVRLMQKCSEMLIGSTASITKAKVLAMRLTSVTRCTRALCVCDHLKVKYLRSELAHSVMAFEKTLRLLEGDKFNFEMADMLLAEVQDATCCNETTTARRLLENGHEKLERIAGNVADFFSSIASRLGLRTASKKNKEIYS